MQTLSPVASDMGHSPADQYFDDIIGAMDSEIFTYNFDGFLAEYGPAPVSSEDIAACRQNLAGSVLDLAGQADRWTAHTCSPIGGKDDVFARMETVQRAVSDWARANGRNKNEYVFETHCKRNHRAGTSRRMDACIVEHEYEGTLPTSYVMFPIAVKTPLEEKKVRECIVADCHRILSEDPRRMFIFALTLENDRASLWYFSRTHSVKARSFDWAVEDVDKFIAMFLSLVYATPEQLGLDPCVHRSPLDDGQYIYEFLRPVSVEAGTETTRETATGVTQAADKRPPGDSLAFTNKVFYLTRENLSPESPLCISGRITRIWKAIEIRSPEDITPLENASEVVIKDVWLHASEDTEGEKQDEIFADLDAFVEDGVKRTVDRYLESNPHFSGDDAVRKRLHASQEMLEAFIDSEPRCKRLDAHTKRRLQGLLTGHKYRSLFLTKLHHSKGRLSKPRAADAVHCPNIFQTAGLCRSNYRRDTSDFERMRKVRINRTWEQRQQHRFVYKEVCLELYRLPTVGDVMDVLSQAADALLIMFCAGWLHRDISLGNILALKTSDGYCVKLTDLEFAQNMDDERRGKSDPRTGTPFFMAHEIMTRRYLIHDQSIVMPTEVPGSLASMFALPSDHPHYNLLSCITKMHPAFLDLSKVPDNADFKQTPPRDSVVRPNYQHDLESLWWIVLFVVTSLVGHPPSQGYAAGVFRHQLEPSDERGRAFRFAIHPPLNGILKADLSKVFAPFLEKLRSKMCTRAITIAVFGQLKRHEEYSEIHGVFSATFRDLMDNSDKCWKAVAIKSSSDLENIEIATGGVSVCSQKTSLDNKRDWEDDDEGSSSRPYKTPRMS